MEWIYFLVFFIILIVIFQYLTSNNNYFAKRGIPFTKPYPIFGNYLPRVIYNRAKPYWLLSMSKKFHPSKIYGVFTFLQPVYVVEDPNIIKQICIKDFDAFSNHIQSVHSKGDAIISKAMLSLNDKQWKEMRTILSPAFTGSKMRTNFNVITDTVLDLVNYCLQNCDENDCFEFNARHLFERHIVDTIALTTFGLKVDSVRDPKNKVFLSAKKPRDIDCVTQRLKFYATMFAPAVMKLFNIAWTPSEVSDLFEKILADTMEHRRKYNMVRPDAVQQLIQAIDLQKSNGQANFTNIDVAAQCFDFLIASLETTAITLTFICYELAVNPDMQQKLYNEILDMETELSGEPITFELLLRMEYLDAFISETMRKHPAVIVQDRVCSKTTQVTDSQGKNYVIEKGMPVWINVLGLHHNPEYFPNPDIFDPERFLGENKQRILPNTYIPFSIGPRSCIGMRLSQLHIKLHLYHLVSQFSVEVCNKTPIPLKYAAVLSMDTAEPVHLVLRKRGH